MFKTNTVLDKLTDTEKMLSNEESAQSIKEYIRSIFNLYKEKTHVDNCLETVITVANHLNIKDFLMM